jgi:hypothetical protein
VSSMVGGVLFGCYWDAGSVASEVLLRIRLSAGLRRNHGGSDESDKRARSTGGARWRKESQPCDRNSNIISRREQMSLFLLAGVVVDMGCKSVAAGTGDASSLLNRVP